MTVRALLFSSLLSCLFYTASQAQMSQQSASFDAITYYDLLQLNFKTIGDTSGHSSYALKKGTYTRLMRSPEVGLYNRCETYMRNDGVAVITLRGTVNRAESWMENFLAAMVTATGSLQLTDSTVFHYRLATDSQAYVHAGWLIGLGYLSPYITAVMDSLLAAGTRSFIITGHSQGGALAFLTTSYLHYKYNAQYPDLDLTAYCSAAPKPGNLYYAYDFNFITRYNHGFRIVNTADWVPENPLSVQTIADMKYPNPLVNAKTTIRKQKFLLRLALNAMYGKMKKSSEKTMNHYRNYMGRFLFKQVHKILPQLQQPDFVFSSNYTTAGTAVILPADSAYYHKFVFTNNNVFIHHGMEAYLYLLRKYYQ